MSWRPHGRAKVNARWPQAWAICDSCGFTYNLVDLRWEQEWQGPNLVNRRILVCSVCNDTPNPQLRSITLPADPPPIENARPPRYSVT